MPLATTLVMIPLSGLALRLQSKLFRLPDQSYKTAVKITAILGVLDFALGIFASLIKSFGLAIAISQWVLVLVLLALFLVKSAYRLKWGKTLLVWLAWFVLYLILLVITDFVVTYVVIGLIFAGKVY